MVGMTAAESVGEDRAVYSRAGGTGGGAEHYKGRAIEIDAWIGHELSADVTPHRALLTKQVGLITRFLDLAGNSHVNSTQIQSLQIMHLRFPVVDPR